MEYQIILTTCPDNDVAQNLATKLVESRLAACVSIIPGITSVYQWKGKVETEQEIQLLIKSKRELFDALTNYIKDNHPYELPEIIAVPITNGLPDYLEWIDEQTG